MTRPNARVLTYPTVLHPAGPHIAGQQRSALDLEPLDALAQRIADRFDVPLVEILDTHGRVTVLAGRLAAYSAGRAADTGLDWSAEAAVTIVGVPRGGVRIHDRSRRQWPPRA